MKRASIFFMLIISIAALAAVSGCGSKSSTDQKPLPDLKTGVNIIKNPSFEKWQGFLPVGWEVKQFAGEGKNTNIYEKSEEAKTGKYSYLLRGLFNTDRWMVLYQVHPVRPGYVIHFSTAIKTQHLKKDEGQEGHSSLYLIFYDKNGKRLDDRYYADAWTREKRGNTDWTVEREKIDVPDKAASVEVGLINQMSGYVWFDDVSVVLEKGLNWQTKETKFIKFCWLPEKPIPEEDMQRETDLIESIAKEAGISKIDGKICYRMYPSEEVFNKEYGIKQYRQAVIWKKKELLTILPYEDHDMVHLILFDLGVPPIGIAKGLVFYFRSEHNGWDLHNAAKQDLLRKQLPALYKTIKEEAFKESDLSVIVPAWGSFSKYMITEYGMDKFLKLYKELDGVKEPSVFNAHFREIYGKNFDEADREWRWFLLRYECDAAADTIF